MTPIVRLHKLIELRLESSCSDADGCTFSWTNGDDHGDVVEIAFGKVCPADSCKTTACSFLFLFAGRKKLKTLEIHFGTRNLQDDLESIPGNPRLRGLCGLPRCQLEWLTIENVPLRVAGEDYELVVAGFFRIFQSVERVSGVDVDWNRLSINKRSDELREVAHES